MQPSWQNLAAPLRTQSSISKKSDSFKKKIILHNMMNLTEITKKNLNAEKMRKNPKNCKESRMISVSVFHPAFSHNKGE